MKTALVISNGRMASCFAGVDLWLVDGDAAVPAVEAPTEAGGAEVLPTHGWHPLAWGRELARHGVGLLLCVGIAPGTWATVRGHGIEVIPNVTGDMASVLAAWRDGKLSPPQLWPEVPDGIGTGAALGRGGGRRRRRFRGGRGF